MKRAPGILFCLLMVGWLVYLFISGTQLPDRVATQFDMNGAVTGWMQRSNYLRLFLILSVLAPLFIVGCLWAIRFIPQGMLNLPRKEAWFLPRHRHQLNALFLNTGFWLACTNLSFLAGVHTLVVHGNRQLPPALNSQLILLAAGVYTLANTLFLLVAIRRLMKGPKAIQGED